jgi:hypothetical protein
VNLGSKRNYAWAVILLSLISFFQPVAHAETQSSYKLKFPTNGQVLKTPTPYLIFYGDWANRGSDISSLQQLLKDYSTSNRFQELTQSFKGIETLTVNNIESQTALVTPQQVNNLGVDTTIGKDLLTESLGIDQIAAFAIKNDFQTLDPNGVYLVITDPKIKTFSWSADSVSSCGWNVYNNSNLIYPSKYIYGWVGDPAQGVGQQYCSYGLSNQKVNYPNGVARDIAGLESTLIHELDESITDPYQNGWEVDDNQPGVDPSETQISDLCEWNFGTSHISNDNNHYWYNNIWNGNFYLIQEEIKLSSDLTGSCAN